MTHGKRARRVPRHSPSPSSVQGPDTLVRHKLEQTTSADRIRVGLHLDLEDVQREEDLLCMFRYCNTIKTRATYDFTNTCQAIGQSYQHASKLVPTRQQQNTLTIRQ